MNGHASLLAAGLLAAVLGGPATAQEIKIAMNGVNDPEANAEAAFARGFADALEGTDFTVEVFPNDTLGSEAERFDQVAQGLVEVNLATVSTAFGMSPLMKGVLLPFMFEDGAEFDAVIDETGLIEEMNAPLVPNGVRLAGFNFIGTGIGIHNSKGPVTRMSDFESMRFRSLNAEQLAYQEALGASGTVISWSEVANAIQTGVADGYFNPPNSAIRTGHTEFLVHFTPADISPSTRAVLISQDWYGGLSDEERGLVDGAVDAGLEANRDWVADWATTVRARHEEAGVTISELEPGEREKMVEATSETWGDIMAEDELRLFTDALAQVRGE